jgi:hypothetical protein
VPITKPAQRHTYVTKTVQIDKNKHYTDKTITTLQKKRYNNNNMPKIMMNYRPDGQRRLGRPLKRLSEEAETGVLGPNS